MSQESGTFESLSHNSHDSQKPYTLSPPFQPSVSARIVSTAPEQYGEKSSGGIPQPTWAAFSSLGPVSLSEVSQS